MHSQINWIKYFLWQKNWNSILQYGSNVFFYALRNLCQNPFYYHIECSYKNQNTFVLRCGTHNNFSNNDYFCNYILIIYHPFLNGSFTPFSEVFDDLQSYADFRIQYMHNFRRKPIQLYSNHNISSGTSIFSNGIPLIFFWVSKE